MLRPYISPATRQLVFERAGRCCEYCKSPADFATEPFSVEHIIPLVKYGLNLLINLALSCSGCNYNKSIKIEFFDPISQTITPFYSTLEQWFGMSILCGMKLVLPLLE